MRKYLELFATFLLGSIVTLLLIQVTSAHGGDSSLIHGCVGTGPLNQGRLRVISASATCNANETPLDWKPYNAASDVPFFCLGCNLQSTTFFSGKVLKGAWLKNADLQSADFTGADLSNALLNNISMQGGVFENVNFSNADMTNAFANTGGGTSFANSNFTGANLTGAVMIEAHFTNANLTNANLTNADFFTADLSGTTRTGVSWSNTRCPDGTNSDSNGNTCEGHL